MAKQPRRPRPADDFAGGPDLDRDWARPGPDYERTKEGGIRPPAPPSPKHDELGPTDEERERLSHPYARGMPETFGFAGAHTYPYAGVASETRRGRFFGRGPKGYRRSDERIREEISDRLMTHPDIDASDIEVTVANGVVILAGTTEDRHEKRLAEYIAEDALGVDDVDNRLKVRHGFWASLIGERAMERELPSGATHRADAARDATGRAIAARNSARRDAEAR